MYEREYTMQRICLTIAMISILYFIGQTLEHKNDISSFEATTYSISNATDDLENNPYNPVVYDKEQVTEHICEEPRVFSLLYICRTIGKMMDNYEGAALLAPPSLSYANTDWVESSYYTNLLSVREDETFQYDKVTKHCVLSQKVPFYYTLLHTISSIFGSLNFYRMGFVINAVFLFLSSFFILAIGKKYLHAAWAGLAAAILFSLCAGGISATLCTTPYIMTIFFLLVNIYIHFAGITRNEIPAFALQALVIVHICGNLTDYSYVLFQLILGVIFSIVLLLYGRIKDFFYYLLANLIALVITIVCYPSFLLHIATFFFETRKNFSNIIKDLQWQTLIRTNLTTVFSQISGSVTFVAAFVFILFLFLAIFLKKETFRENLHSFIMRIQEYKICDLLLCLIAVAYFLCIIVFCSEKNYFLLLTVTPFFILFLCYLFYRFCNAAIHSEFNSGIISIIFVVLLSFITITTTTPKFLYTESLQYTNFAERNNQQYCLFLSSDTLSVKDHILELEKYEHSMVTTKEHLFSLKKNKAFLEQKQILLYLSNKDYVNSYMDKIAKFGKFEITNEITNYIDKSNHRVYIFQLSQLD